VLECAVIGVADADRGQIVQAHVVLTAGHAPNAATTRALQDHVKAVIAPYKYPRSVVFTEALPKTQTGKIQRFRLRDAR
jgi:2-aminobenzoate-CoA ligase